MKTCIRCETEQPTTEFYKHSRSADRLSYACKTCLRHENQAWCNSEHGKQTRRNWNKKQENLPRKLIYAARRRASRDKIPCTVTLEDIHIPEYCPVLGIPLIPGDKIGPTDNAPTLDRIIPALGYVPGNILVMSHKANRMKTNASLEELAAFATWVTKLIAEQGAAI